MQLQDGSMGKLSLAHIIAASFAGAIAAATAARYRLQKSSPAVADLQKLTPLLHRTESGRVGELEKFSHYVARQIGFEDGNEVPELCKLANAYLTKNKGCDESIYEYFADEEDADSLYVKLVDEFERCILSYFSFHWHHASSIVTLVNVNGHRHIESNNRNEWMAESALVITQ